MPSSSPTGRFTPNACSTAMTSSTCFAESHSGTSAAAKSIRSFGGSTNSRSKTSCSRVRTSFSLKATLSQTDRRWPIRIVFDHQFPLASGGCLHRGREAETRVEFPHEPVFGRGQIHPADPAKPALFRPAHQLVQYRLLHVPA